MNKPKSRLMKAAEKKNEILVSKVMNGKDSVFARVEANLGPQFRISIFDGKRIIQVFGISRLKKKQVQININDIVLLSSNVKEGEVGEIIGRVGRAGEKEARPLLKEGRIHKEIFLPIQITGECEALDDIFEEAEGEDQEVNPDDI